MSTDEQIPKSAMILFAVVGEMIEIKKKFDDGELSMDALADQLWAKMSDLETKHANVQRDLGVHT